MSSNASSYAPDDRAKRLLRTAQLRPVLPFAGFAAITIAMMVTGGAGVIIPMIGFGSLLLTGGAIWVQRFQDRKDAESQAQFRLSDVIATPAVLSRPNGVAAQQGELRISSSGIQWLPRPPSREEAICASREQITAVSLVPRGLTVKRASLVLDTTSETLIFVTAGRFERVLRGVRLAGMPSSR